MKNITDKQLDKFARKVMRSTSLEAPSLGFTTHVMSHIKTIKAERVFDSKPLISKTIWFFIVIFLVGLLVYAVLGTSPKNLGWFDSINFNFISKVKLTELISGITFSKTALYALVLFGIMFFIQVSFLKNYFDRRLEV